MIELYPNLFVGSDEDAHRESSQWVGGVVHAAKEPWHREAVGYYTRGCPPDWPDYFYAIRGHDIFLNLIDPQEVHKIPWQVIDAGITFIANLLSCGQKVLVHCNRGESRGPGLVMLYLLSIGVLPNDVNGAFSEFHKLYPPFNPGKGMSEFIRRKLNG